MFNLSNIKTIKSILTRYGFHFSKYLGQNFLIDSSVSPKMAGLCGISENTGVLEIGPGIGTLTRELAKRAKKVVAVEIDKQLIPVLKETLADFDNINIINGDILKIDLRRLIEESFTDQNVVVCANLPYYITSPIIMKLLESHLPIKSITAMVQKETALRFCAKPGSRSGGAITVAIHYYSMPELLFQVPKSAFFPSPNVDSAVIKLDVLGCPPVCVNDEKIFWKVIKAAFAQRRKTLLNSLSAGLGINKETTSQILKTKCINPSLRAENLTMTQFADIANCLYQETENDKKA